MCMYIFLSFVFHQNPPRLSRCFRAVRWPHPPAAASASAANGPSSGRLPPRRPPGPWRGQWRSGTRTTVSSRAPAPRVLGQQRSETRTAVCTEGSVVRPCHTPGNGTTGSMLNSRVQERGPAAPGASAPRAKPHHQSINAGPKHAAWACSQMAVEMNAIVPVTDNEQT